LLVGVAQKDITPEIGVPLAGFGGKNRRLLPWDILDRYPYAHFFKPSTGLFDPVKAKAMLLHNGEGTLIFLSLDVVAVTAPVVNDIHQRIQQIPLTDYELFISATHTHSGPGNLSRNTFWQRIATDRFDRSVYEQFLTGITETIEQAQASFTEAQLVAGSFEVKNVQINRSRPGGPFDPEANILLAKSGDGRWLGGLVNFAIHGTALGDWNLRFSADVPGAIASALADKLRHENGLLHSSKVVLLFMNGAEGDVSPIDHGRDGMQKLGETFAEQAYAVLKQLRPIPAVWSIQSREVVLGAPRVELRNCTGGSGFSKLIPEWLDLSFSETMPQKTRIWTIQFADMIFLTFPGEATTALGFELKDLAAEAGFSQTWILGLTNDYLAYFTTPSEYDNGIYEACSSFYGKFGGSKIKAQHKKLLGL
jgi:hypothetical protein